MVVQYLISSCIFQKMALKKFRLFLTGDIFKEPVLAAQLTGMFPLSLTRSPEPDRLLHLTFSWKGCGTIAIIFRVLLLFLLLGWRIYDRKGVLLEACFGQWSNTAALSQNVTNSIITIADFTWVVVLLHQRKHLDRFFTEVVAFVRGFPEISNDVKEFDLAAQERISKKHSHLKCTTGMLWTLFLLAYCGSLITYIPRVGKAFEGDSTVWVKVIVVAFALLHFMISSQFRLLSFFLPTTFMVKFQVAYALLRNRAESLNRKEGISIHEVEEDIDWIQQQYDHIIKLLKEFHCLFDFQLIVGILTILLTMLDSTFQVLLVVMRTAKGSLEFTWYQILSLMPLQISLVVTFYQLCDAATAMTEEAMLCVLSFRNCPGLDNFPIGLKEKILLFYVQRIAKPPVVSPGNMYTLGRHLFPTVRADIIYKTLLLHFLQCIHFLVDDI